MTAEELWSRYLQAEGRKGGEYSAWAFGGAPDELARLVLEGTKTGTASAFPLYELENEPIPQAGEHSVVLDSHDNALCVIETTRVYVVPFREVSPEHAFKEGEGDRSLAYWRQVHTDFFTGEMTEAGLVFTEDMPVVCEEFKVVYK